MLMTVRSCDGMVVLATLSILVIQMMMIMMMTEDVLSIYVGVLLWSQLYEFEVMMNFIAMLLMWILLVL